MDTVIGMAAALDLAVKPEARPYVEAFERIARSEPEWLGRARRGAIARFAETGFPGRRSESWRYLDLRGLESIPVLQGEPSPPSAMRSDLGVDGVWATLNLLDGHCISVVSRGLPEGIWFHPTRRAITERPELVREALARNGAGGPSFAALGTALFSDGFVLDVAPHAALNKPLEVVHFASKAGAVHTRNLVRLGAGARVTLVETYAGTDCYWRNTLTTVELSDGAELTRIVVIEEGDEATHTGLAEGRLGAESRLNEFALLLSGGTVRHETSAWLAGERGHCGLDGAFIVAGRDQANIVTTVDHQAPGCETRELIKGVGAGRGQGAFQGRIIVRPGAQKTHAQQTSRNLIIGERAVIDTKPELEIYADDVKCAHGATVGDLDENALFYLHARGIPESEARRILIEGFAREAVEQVQHPELREHLLRRLSRRLASLEA